MNKWCLFTGMTLSLNKASTCLLGIIEKHLAYTKFYKGVSKEALAMVNVTFLHLRARSFGCWRWVFDVDLGVGGGGRIMYEYAVLCEGIP